MLSACALAVVASLSLPSSEPTVIVFPLEDTPVNQPFAFEAPTCSCETLGVDTGYADHNCQEPLTLCYKLEDEQWEDPVKGECPEVATEECRVSGMIKCQAKFKFKLVVAVTNACCCPPTGTNAVWFGGADTGSQLTPGTKPIGPKTIFADCKESGDTDGPLTNWYFSCTTSTPSATDKQLQMAARVKCEKCKKETGTGE